MGSTRRRGRGKPDFGTPARFGSVKPAALCLRRSHGVELTRQCDAGFVDAERGSDRVCGAKALWLSPHGLLSSMTCQKYRIGKLSSM